MIIYTMGKDYDNYVKIKLMLKEANEGKKQLK